MQVAILASIADCLIGPDIHAEISDFRPIGVNAQAGWMGELDAALEQSPASICQHNVRTGQSGGSMSGVIDSFRSPLAQACRVILCH